VIYHLHPTFRDPDREITDCSTQFALETAGWGMFNRTADVYVKGRVKPVELERYINF
jgi:transcription initiation factor IIF auxiliary subunit